MKTPTAKQRAYAYRVLLAAAAVAAFYGLITSEELAVWAALAATALGTTGAALNTSTKRDDTSA